MLQLGSPAPVIIHWSEVVHLEFLSKKNRQNRSLKTAPNHKFQFLERHNSKSFGKGHVTHTLAALTQIVRTSNSFIKKLLLKLPPATPPKENLANTAESNSGFIFL